MKKIKSFNREGAKKGAKEKQDQEMIEKDGGKMKTRTKVILVVLIVAALFLIACTRYQYQIKVSYPGDEAWVMNVCSPSNKDCRVSYPAELVAGTGDKAPPVGTYCKDLGDNILDCGKKYVHVRIFIPPN